LEAQKRKLPEITDDFANKVRKGLSAQTLKDELQKAVDQEDAKEYVPARNDALAKALAKVMDVEVPDTLVTNQARDKFALMMSDMRSNGVADDEIKNQINPENFLKYKKIVKDDIVADFKVSMATDEIGRIENIEVDDYKIEEQMESIRKEAAESQEEFDETQIRSRVEATLQRQAVMDFLAENSDLEVEFVEDSKFDESLMEDLAKESIAREKDMKEKTDEESGESGDQNLNETDDNFEAIQTRLEEQEQALSKESKTSEIANNSPAGDRDTSCMSLQDKAFYAIVDSGALEKDDAN